MISSIRISNFQIHRDISFLFHKGVNVISGTSGSGKSACIRAIQWVSKNRPAGNSIKNSDSKDESVIVEITTSDDQSVLKERKNDKAKYIVNNGFKAPLDAIGRDIPIEVNNILNLSDYNIQGQHDEYFLVQNSPGERAKQLNIFTGMEVIDILFANLNEKINDTKKTLVKAEAEKILIKKESEAFDDLEEIEEIITSIKLSSALCDKYNTIALGLETSIDEIKKLELLLQESEDFLLLETDTNEIVKLIGDSKELGELQNRMMLSVSLIKENEDSIKEYNKILSLEKEASLFMNLEDKCFSIEEEEDSLKAAVKNLKQTEQELYETSQLLIEIEGDNQLLLDTLEVCPFCGNEMKE